MATEQEAEETRSEEHLSDILAEARRLRAAQDFELALQMYLHLFEESRTSEGFAGVRLSFVISEIHEMNAYFPNATQTLLQLRNDREEKMRGGDCSEIMIAEWYAINEQIDPSRSIEFYDEMKKNEKENWVMLGEMRKHVWTELVRLQRYRELNDDDLYMFFMAAASIVMAEQFVGVPESMKPGEEGMKQTYKLFRTKFLDESSLLFECALAKNNEDITQRIYQLVAKYEHSAESYSGLINAAIRCGALNCAHQITDDAKAQLRGEERAAIEELEQTIPE